MQKNTQGKSVLNIDTSGMNEAEKTKIVLAVLATAVVNMVEGCNRINDPATWAPVYALISSIAPIAVPLIGRERFALAEDGLTLLADRMEMQAEYTQEVREFMARRDHLKILDDALDFKDGFCPCARCEARRKEAEKAKAEPTKPEPGQGLTGHKELDQAIAEFNRFHDFVVNKSDWKDETRVLSIEATAPFLRLLNAMEKLGWKPQPVVA